MIHEAVQAVQEFGSDCILVKRDFESAFRNIPVSHIDSPLLGFQWGNSYYTERILPFELRIAPYLFNLFAEVFHWIVEAELGEWNIQARIIRVLDYFLLVLPPGTCTQEIGEIFTELCEAVGLSIKTSKNEEGCRTCFGGVELNTKEMVMRLPTKKLQKARLLVQSNSDWKSVTLLDLQQITRYLNFVAIVVPLGRTFLRRLYNMELYFPGSGQYQRRWLSSEARKDIDWWWEALAGKPERSILTRVRQTISTWSDAARTKGLGGYYTCETQPLPQPNSVFAIVLPNNPTRQREHINT